MKLIYDIKDKPKFGQVIVFAFQQLLAILAATIAVPAIIGHDMSQSAALFGAGIGTIVYLLFTKFRSGFPWFFICIHRINARGVCRQHLTAAWIFRPYIRCILRRPCLCCNCHCRKDFRRKMD